jgi:uncharacterized protein
MEMTLRLCDGRIAAETAVAYKPVWVDRSSGDAAGSRDFYSKLFGWKVEVNPDPQYGGYAMATIGGKDVAGIGPKQMAEAPSAWTVYIGTSDAADTVKKAEAAGGKVIAPLMVVGDQGSMAIIQDPSGAMFGVWQSKNMTGSQVMGEANTYGWAELNSRGVDKAKPFYTKLFGWGEKKSEMAPGEEYTEFLAGGESIAGGMDEQDGSGPGAELLARVLHRRRRRQVAQDSGRARGEGDVGAAGVPGRPILNP